MYSEEHEDELSLNDYLAIIRRRWLWVCVPLVAITVLAAIYTTSRPDAYSATARVVLAPSAAQEATVGLNQNTYFLERELTNEVNFAYSDAVVADVEDQLGFSPSVNITVDSTSDTLIFSSTEGNPIDAANSANAWAQTYIEAKRVQAQTSINGALAQAQTRLVELRQERLDLRTEVDALRTKLDRESDPTNRSLLQG